MKTRIAVALVLLDPRAHEVLWVLLAAAGINIMTGALDAGPMRTRRVILGSIVVVVAVLVFLAGQCAKEVRDRAFRLQVEARHGALQEHIRAAIKEPGYSDSAVALIRWVAAALVTTTVLVLLAVRWV
jgi:hypothetical protein